jgi:mannosyltransferase OCH1-like enzyme
MIPKIIHQTWKTTTVPDQWKDAVKSCKEINDYQYILWTDEDMIQFVKKEFPHLYELYTSYKYDIQRCDAFRYLVLYKYGGIYLDMDIVCKKKLDDLLKHDIVFARYSNLGNYFTNSFIMISPNHPFFLYCINNLYKNMDSYKYLGKHLHVMNSAGPGFLTKMIKEYGSIQNSYTLTKNEFAGSCNVCNETTCKGGVYFKHLPGNSWHSLDSTIYNFVFCHKILIASFIVSVILLKQKTKPFRRLGTRS